MTRRSTAGQTCTFEHHRGSTVWPPSARRSVTLLQRRWPALVQVRCARSNSPVLRLASARCSLVNHHRAQFLSGRCVRSKIGAPASLQPLLLRGPAFFEHLGRRARRRWATPRHPVRRSRPDTSYLPTPYGVRCFNAPQDRCRAICRPWPRSRRLRTFRARAPHEGVRLVHVGRRSK